MSVLLLSGARHLIENFRKSAKGLEIQEVESRYFPDNELYLRIPSKPKEDVILVQSMHGEPDKRLTETVFAAKTLKELGDCRITALIPYLAYTRQDKRYKEGEAISQILTLELLSFSGIDKIITIDAHFHAGMPKIKGLEIKNLKLASHFKSFFEKFRGREDYVVIGPDDDAFELANLLAKELELGSGFIDKKRLGDEKVELFSINVEVKGKHVILMDDIISTGSTVVEAIKFLRKKEAKEIHVVATHGLFVSNAIDKLKALDVQSIITSNSVPNPFAFLDVVPILLEELGL